MSSKQKLELTWIGKDRRPRLEPRILLEDPDRSYHARQRVGEDDIFDNRLIFGDNLLALKALEQKFTGRVKCVLEIEARRNGSRNWKRDCSRRYGKTPSSPSNRNSQPCTGTTNGKHEPCTSAK